jgi:hypothetical protein
MMKAVAVGRVVLFDRMAERAASGATFAAD